MQLSLEDALRVILVAILFAWVWLIGSHLETPYPPALVEAYAIPLTRFILLAMVLALTSWCPTAGVFAAMAFILLGSDVLALTKGKETFQS